MANITERDANCNDCLHVDVCTFRDASEDEKICRQFINKADVVEVRHAQFKWGYQNGQYGIWCTNCGTGWRDSENAEWIAREHDYCPNCGAKMDGKGEGE